MVPKKLEAAGIRQVLKVNGIPSNFPYDKNKITEKVISFDDNPTFVLPKDQLEICF